MKAIAPEDLRAIWKAALVSSKRDFALITIMATTGMRAGELVSMNLRYLDLQAGEVWVQGKTDWREMFLGEAGVQAIQEYLQERADSSCQALWLGCRGEPLTTDGVRRMVYRLADQAQVKGRHNLHAFRHRLAQSWLDQKINAEIVMQALGHANVSITLSIYGNQNKDDLRRAIQKVELAPFHSRHRPKAINLTDVVNFLND